MSQYTYTNFTLCLSEYGTDLHYGTVAAPAHVQLVQRDRPHRDQGIRHDAVLLHDVEV